MQQNPLFEILDSLSIYARYLTGDRDQADELTQDLALYLLAHPQCCDAVKSPKAYLKTMLRNRFLDQCRKRSREPGMVAFEETEIVLEVDPLEPRFDLAEARAAMAQLPEEFQRVINLRAEAEMTYAEISQTLKLPVGTVMSRLHRARARLKLELEDA